MKTILITGANGFVGSNLHDHLSPDYRLIGIDITTAGKYPHLFGWNELDTLPPADTIIHLAAKAHDTLNTAREEEYFEINVGLTKKIFDYFLRSGTRKFIFFSSVKAIADTVKGEWLYEDDEPDPQTPYGKSKLEAERYILKRLRDLETEGESGGTKERGNERSGGPNKFCNPKSQIPNPKSEIRNPKSIYILRPAMIHGPGNKGNLNLLYKVVSRGFPWPLGEFDNQRSFTSVGNLSFILRQLIEGEIAPGIYQVADDEPVSTNEIIRMIAGSLGRAPRIWRLPAGMIRAVARVGDFTGLPLNRERLKKLTETYRVSNKKLKAALGIEKLPVSAREGLIKTLNSYREDKQLIHRRFNMNNGKWRMNG